MRPRLLRVERDRALELALWLRPRVYVLRRPVAVLLMPDATPLVLSAGVSVLAPSDAVGPVAGVVAVVSDGSCCCCGLTC